MIFASKEYIVQIKNIFDENFGVDYLTEDEILFYIKDENSFLIIDLTENRVNAIVLYIVESIEKVSSITKIPVNNIYELFSKNKLIHCKCLCVKKELQKQGYGRELFKKSLGFIFSKYDLDIFAILWKYNGIVPAEQIVIEMGFKKLKELPSPFFNYDNYHCIICNGKCKCPGIFYYLKKQNYFN